ncbi:hypothetical protein ABPG75_005359 [Micractinium tetrahymenae]
MAARALALLVLLLSSPAALAGRSDQRASSSAGLRGPAARYWRRRRHGGRGSGGSSAPCVPARRSVHLTGCVSHWPAASRRDLLAAPQTEKYTVSAGGQRTEGDVQARGLASGDAEGERLAAPHLPVSMLLPPTLPPHVQRSALTANPN